ncbi:MAG: hypothetical protein OXI96_08250 [Acidimicrobiaceae bacterium]|nr:hypothetical protein [Acidimicrobiaceae bacterium]
MFEDIDTDLNYLTDHLKQLGDPSERIGPVIVTYALTTIHEMHPRNERADGGL